MAPGKTFFSVSYQSVLLLIFSELIYKKLLTCVKIIEKYECQKKCQNFKVWQISDRTKKGHLWVKSPENYFMLIIVFKI